MVILEIELIYISRPNSKKLISRCKKAADGFREVSYPQNQREFEEVLKAAMDRSAFIVMVGGYYGIPFDIHRAAAKVLHRPLKNPESMSLMDGAEPIGVDGILCGCSLSSAEKTFLFLTGDKKENLKALDICIHNTRKSSASKKNRPLKKRLFHSKRIVPPPVHFPENKTAPTTAIKAEAAGIPGDGTASAPAVLKEPLIHSSKADPSAAKETQGETFYDAEGNSPGGAAEPAVAVFRDLEDLLDRQSLTPEEGAAGERLNPQSGKEGIAPSGKNTMSAEAIIQELHVLMTKMEGMNAPEGSTELPAKQGKAEHSHTNSSAKNGLTAAKALMLMACVIFSVAFYKPGNNAAVVAWAEAPETENTVAEMITAMKKSPNTAGYEYLPSEGDYVPTVTPAETSSSSDQSSAQEVSEASSKDTGKPPQSSKAAERSGGASGSGESSKESSSSKNNNSESSSAKENNSSSKNIIRVRNEHTGSVVEDDATAVIAMIIEAEMGSSYHMEALKAQAVAAYSWLCYNGVLSGGVPSAPMRTAGSRAKEAASAVAGQRLLSGGSVCNATYFAISAGKTANASDIWGGKASYLVSADSGADTASSGFRTTRSYSAEQVQKWIKDQYDIDLSKVKKEKWFAVAYDSNGLYAKSVNLGGKITVSGHQIRSNLFTSSRVGGQTLRSSAFSVTYQPANDTFVFDVKGYGHGVGMSQVGANAYANQGWGYQKILTHYYTGTTIG